jgi:hypothetical protein
VWAITSLLAFSGRAGAQATPADDAAAPASEPSGPPLEPRALPPAGSLGWPRVCSTRHRLCVRPSARVARARALDGLASVERDWDMATDVLGLPAPDAALDGAYDVYLVDANDAAPIADGGATFVAERDVRSALDRASAFTVVDARLAGCAFDATLARELARASLLRAAPATAAGVAQAEAAYPAKLMVPCSVAFDDGTPLFQMHPDRAIVDGWPDAEPGVGKQFDRGASTFFWWLDSTYGTSPASVVRGTWALTATRTPLGSWLWNGDPDAFAVLKATFKGALGTGSTVDDLYVDFAVARAFLGSADDGQHLPESRTLGDGARVRVDWDVAWPSSARRFQSSTGVGPLGAAYVLVHHAGAPPSQSLRVEVSWEEHARMRWVVVKLDAQGKEMAEMTIPSLDLGTEAQLTVMELDQVDSVLLVGVNLGDPKWAFDPDDGVWEPHGWIMTVASR